MIRDQLFTLGKKITWYKRLLFIFLALNVFAITTGAVLGYNYWNGGFSKAEEIQALVERSKKLVELEIRVADLKVDKLLLSRSEALKEMQSWQRILVLANNLGMGQDWEEAYQNPKVTSKRVNQTVAAVTQARMTALDTIAELNQNQSIQRKTLIWVGAITFIFGIILPLIITMLLGRALKKAQSMLVLAAREFIKDWRMAVDKGGPEAFKNPQFWVEAALILSHHLSQQIEHPIIQMSGELAGLVQSELAIARKKVA